MNAVAYNVAISVCEKGRGWWELLAFLNRMAGDGIEISTISYNAAISVQEGRGVGGGRWAS